MKTAALARKPVRQGEHSGGGAGKQKPFFRTRVQNRSEEDAPSRMTVGAAGDRFEREADAVADRVVDGKTANPGSASLAAGVTPLTQREAEKGDVEAAVAEAAQEEEQLQARAAEEEPADIQAEEEEVQAQEEEESVQARAEEEDLAQRKGEEEEETVQARAEEDEVRAQAEEEVAQTRAGDAESGEEPETVQAKPGTASERDEEPVQARAGNLRPTPVAADTARDIEAASGRGNPLPDTVRDKMSAAFGADFSGIRIHTDAPAVLLAKQLRAQAFTRGRDIFFNEGKFAPGSRSGAHLLAHELTHTIQQGAVRPGHAAAGGQTGQTGTRTEPDADVINLAPDDDVYEIRPEMLEALRLARGEIGKVNAKLHGSDGKRIGWQRIREYFNTAFGGPVVSEQVIDRVVMITKDGKKMDALPSWCGIFTWWAMKKAGVPLPDWKLGAPALDALKPRPPGEMPRKGDIAIDVVPNNHFALVSGLETVPDPYGGPGKLTRISTVNGNTAGQDNLGGQVEERWHPISHWDHFLDPVGKIAMPDRPLVKVSWAQDLSETENLGGDAEPAAKPDAETVEAEKPRPDVVALETDVEPAPPDIDTAAPPEPDLSLPPPADTGPAEQVATVEAADLSGSSDEAMTSFVDASPSAMAAAEPALGSTLDGKMKGEQTELAENPPVLEAKTSGAVDAPIIGPDQIPIPGETGIGPGAAGQDATIATVNGPTPAPFRGNADRENELEKENTGSFWDAFKNFMRRFSSGIRTRDDSIDTSAGSRPSVALEGDANPGEMASEGAKGTEKLQAQRDTHVTAFRNHPGQSNIQPRKIDEQRPAPVSTEPAETVEMEPHEPVQEYAQAPLPADVRSAADAKIAQDLHPNLAEARKQTTDAASTRDTDKKTEIDNTQAEAKKLNEQADTDQRNIVIENRTKVAKMQGEGIGTAYQEVNAFKQDAAKEQTSKRKEIGDHVKEEEGKAKKELEQGEADAEAEKTKKEKEAAEKKKKLEEEQKNDSWWDKVKSAVKKAVKAITKAIDFIFTELRKAVKTIIEKAKNAAIGLINKARKWVVDKINKFRDWAKDQVNKYLKDTFPGLAKRINDGIDAMADTAIDGVNAVADAAIAGINKLADALAAALDKILATFQTALKTAVRVAGAVIQGDFAEALRAAIEGACEIAGVDPKPIFDFLDRAGKAIQSILKDPVGFIKKLFGAIGQGISNFFGNIKQHMIEGVVAWLTGALSSISLSGPFEFSVKGVLRIVLEILGITYANIKARVIKKIPAAAKVFDVIEKGFVLLHKLVTEGPTALWEEIKKSLSNLKEMVMGAIRNFLITAVIKEGITWLLSLTNPASAIVKAIKLLFDLVMFLIERYEQIKQFIMSVYESVAAVASGNFTAVTTKVEDALRRAIPVLISLVASVFGLGDIAKKVQGVIQKITEPINKAIDWVIDRVIKFAKKVLAKLKAGAKAAKKKAKAAIAKVVNWWKTRSKFKDKTGQPHTLSYKGSKKSAKLYVASDPQQITAFLKDRKAKAKDGGTKYTVADVTAAQNYHKTKVIPAEKKLREADTGGSAEKKAKAYDANKALADELQKHLDHLGATWLGKFFESETDFPPPQLPVMADNVKARSLEADYIVRSSKFKYKVNTGSESGQHVGNIEGWPDLQGAKLTTGSKYVRMHLLPHRLGGNAVDSNLTPARGSLYNTPFSNEVEQPAIKASVEGPEAKRKPVWYKFTISYWADTTSPPPTWPAGTPYPAGAFPNKIHAEWGHYKTGDSNSADIIRGPIEGKKSESPALPDLNDKPAINVDGPQAIWSKLTKQDSEITFYFVSDILVKQRPYNSKTAMKNTLWQKFGGKPEAKRRRFVKATYDAVGTHVTMD